jgi:hypothetical protein
MTPRHTLKITFVAALGALAIFLVPALAGARGSHSHDTTGTITALDTATSQVTIELNGGEDFTAVVDRHTKIRCEDQSGDGRHAGGAARRGGESEPGDDHGGRGSEAGDDNGGHGEEAGDDSGGSASGPGRGGHDDNGFGANCTRADLTVGATVHKAELELEHGQASWDEVDLEGTGPEGPTSPPEGPPTSP